MRRWRPLPEPGLPTEVLVASMAGDGLHAAASAAALGPLLSLPADLLRGSCSQGEAVMGVLAGESEAAASRKVLILLRGSLPGELAGLPGAGAAGMSGSCC